jgi:hypothetical protein
MTCCVLLVRVPVALRFVVHLMRLVDLSIRKAYCIRKLDICVRVLLSRGWKKRVCVHVTFSILISQESF